MNQWIILASLFAVSFAHADSRELIEQRIKPVGQVQFAGDAAAKAKAASQAEATTVTIKAEPKVVAAVSGEAVYKKACGICHAAGVAGAPKFKDKASWGVRPDKGMESLLASVKKGKGAMPAMGMCNDCSDEALTAAIKYMLPS